MKKIKYLVLGSLFLLGSVSSCDDALDINQDPFVSSSADPNAVLPFVYVQYSSRKTTELGTRIADVSQYMSANFNSPRNGNTSIFLTGNTWSMLYTQALGNLRLVRSDAQEAGPFQNNVNAIATILSAHYFYELPSIWEEVPFSEALSNEEFPFPNFESQEAVFNGVVSLLDEGMALIDNSPEEVFAITPASDMFYGGDMASWRVLANSLKLRALMMLRSGGANVDAEINECLSQPLMEENSQAALLIYSGEPGAQSGLNTIITAFGGPDNETDNIHGPGDPIDELLNGSGDPRFDLWIARNDLPAPGNAFFPDPSTSVLSNNIIRPDLPDVLMTPAEIDLYKAELALEGIAGAGGADRNYRNGVTNAIKWWGQDIPGVIETVSDADIDAYVSSLGEPTLEDVYTQQYLASFLMPVMAWNNVRRNQVPELTPPPATNIGAVLRRFNYPPDEIGSNPNTPDNKQTNVPMWFEN